MVLNSFGSDSDQRKAVVVLGEAPTLIEVLKKGPKAMKPFDLESLMRYSEKGLWSESLNFWLEVEEFKELEKAGMEGTVRYKEASRLIIKKYIGNDSDDPVNISAATMEHTINAVKVACDAIAAGTGKGDWNVFGTAQSDIFLVMERDNYARYVNYVTVNRQLNLSKIEAQWWLQIGTGTLTWDKFWSFPSPINECEARIHAFCTVALLAAALILYETVDNSYGAFWFITYGFLARVLCGPRLDPQAMIVLFVIRPIVVDTLGLLEDKFTASSPKRFAQVCGLFFGIGCSIAATLGNDISLYVIFAAFFGASFLSSFCDLCIACKMFKFFASRNMIPSYLCKDCTLYYVAGTKAVAEAPYVPEVSGTDKPSPELACKTDLETGTSMHSVTVDFCGSCKTSPRIELSQHTRAMQEKADRIESSQHARSPPAPVVEVEGPVRLEHTVDTVQENDNQA